ncbi:MAG TPA: DNA cytosine methyltransferase [Candidatus Saccharimonadales bacterium]|nr:DNA cytosine methyltransferase [Candidatus Saccharimonadales bacterium]
MEGLKDLPRRTGSAEFVVASLFSGIGGIELGLERSGISIETRLLCEYWPPAQAVLAQHFEGEFAEDIRTLKALPAAVNLVTAGFPCTDLSQAGRTAGIRGPQSGLVSHMFQLLRRRRETGRAVRWVVIENVPNMLALEKGRAMHYLVDSLDDLGYRWAYRVVDSRFTGVPQRRRRVVLVASVEGDPRAVLFADDAGEPPAGRYTGDAFGFYWTEGRGGLGWAQDAVPTLKGGSTVGIPSPPAVWVPGGAPGRTVITPSIQDAEQLQGFPAGWTEAAELYRANSPRWKLVGNAVTVDVARWVGSRIASPGEPVVGARAWSPDGAWPTAAWGERGRVWKVAASEYPREAAYAHLLDVVDAQHARPLTQRATAGFLKRLREGNLGWHPGFREAIAAHVLEQEAERSILIPA